MPSTHAVAANNRLLGTLPSKERQHVLASCKTVELMLADVLANPGDPIRYVYFPTGSVISLVMPIDGGASLEVGLIGDEGMLGITLMLEVDVAPFHAVVQGAGPALRITAPSFLRELEQSSVLQRELKRYLYVTICDDDPACANGHLHPLPCGGGAPRPLAVDDARPGARRHISVTHVFLAYMLGVRRVGITKAANSLQRKNLHQLPPRGRHDTRPSRPGSRFLRMLSGRQRSL